MDRQRFVQQYDRVRSLEECERSCAGLANYFGIKLRVAEEAINRSRKWDKPASQLQSLTTKFALGYQQLLDNHWTNALLDEGFKRLLHIIGRLVTLQDGTLDPLAELLKWLPAGAAYKLSQFLAGKQLKWKCTREEATTYQQLMDEFWEESRAFRHQLKMLKNQFAREAWS